MIEDARARYTQRDTSPGQSDAETEQHYVVVVVGALRGACERERERYRRGARVAELAYRERNTRDVQTRFRSNELDQVLVGLVEHEVGVVFRARCRQRE